GVELAVGAVLGDDVLGLADAAVVDGDLEAVAGQVAGQVGAHHRHTGDADVRDIGGGRSEACHGISSGRDDCRAGPLRSGRPAGGGPGLPPSILGTPGPPCRAVPGFAVTTARAGTVTASPSTAVTGPNESDASDDPSLPRARPVRTRGPSGHRSRRRRRRGRTL